MAMFRCSHWAIGLVVTWLGCTNAAITQPIVANTGMAKSSEGYQAALATAEAGGYSIVVKDPKNAFLRVRVRSSSGLDPASAVCFEVRAWSGSVDVVVAVPPGLKLDESRISDLRGERMELAWAISRRARMLAGEPLESATSVPPDGVLTPFPYYQSGTAPSR